MQPEACSEEDGSRVGRDTTGKTLGKTTACQRLAEA